MRTLAITVSALAIALASFGCKGNNTSHNNMQPGQGGGPQSGHQMGDDYRHPSGGASVDNNIGPGTSSEGWPGGKSEPTGGTGPSTMDAGAVTGGKDAGGPTGPTD